MAGGGPLDWLDNPIFIKHVRSRLRRQPFIAALTVVLVLCGCILYAGRELETFKTGMAAGQVLALQTIVLLIVGAGQVNASVNGARASGVLDFHRISPLSPERAVLGFFFGAPVREYLMFAATLPAMAICMAHGVPSLRGAVQLTIALISITWVIHGFALLNGLLSRSKAPSGGMIGVAVFVLLFGLYLVLGGQYAVNLGEGERRLSFFGISLPWLPVVLIYQIPVLVFLFLASSRKMRSARLHPLSRPQAIVAMAAYSALVLGGIWRQGAYEICLVVAFYVLTVLAILLSAVATPTQAEYYKGLWRAQKLGLRHLPWWDDFAHNWLFVVVLAGIVLAAGTLALSFPGEKSFAIAPLNSKSLSLSLALCVLVAAYFGLAFQYFRLRFAGRGGIYFGLFLFLTWMLPLVLGLILVLAVGPSSLKPEQALPMIAFSPVAGIGVVALRNDGPNLLAVQASALVPALLFAFGFSRLLTGARRRVIQAVVYQLALKNKAPVIGFGAPGPTAEERKPLQEAPTS